MCRNQQHTTVLLREAVEALAIDSNATYVDGTFGRGGHSRLILAALSNKGRLYAVDKDAQAIAAGSLAFAQDSRFTLFHGSFVQSRQCC